MTATSRNSLRFLSAALLGAVMLTASPLQQARAAEAPTKESAQVKSGLYVTATEAAALLEEDKTALLIDVRDPVEIMFTGHAKGTDIFIPWRFARLDQWNGKKDVFKMALNSNFASELEAELQKRGADKETRLIFICRSGSTRSGPAADALYDLGYKASYTVVDGFEGGKLPEGPSKGVRAKDGWRNSGLAWTYKMDEQAMKQAVSWTTDEK